jgi:hypothetical protein
MRAEAANVEPVHAATVVALRLAAVAAVAAATWSVASDAIGVGNASFAIALGFVSGLGSAWST